MAVFAHFSKWCPGGWLHLSDDPKMTEKGPKIIKNVTFSSDFSVVLGTFLAIFLVFLEKPAKNRPKLPLGWPENPEK